MAAAPGLLPRQSVPPATEAAIRKLDIWSVAQGLLHSHDSEIVTESRRDTPGPSPQKGHIVDVASKGSRMRKRVLLISGLSLAVVGVFGAGYTFRDLAKGITEAPTHWWSTAPWIAIGLGVVLLVLARI